MNSPRNQRTSRTTLMRSLARWAPHFFFITGTIALGYVAVTLLDAKIFQADAARIFEQAQKERRAQKNTSATGNRTSPDSRIPALRLSQQNHPATEGGTTVPSSRAWGRIEISSIGLSSMILEGVERKTLQRGVGHIPGTALPGQPGNVALAGHRDTFFRALRNIRTGDEITLETLDETYHYRVDLTQVVAPEDTEVLRGSNNQILTLVTCYPFSFVGPAPQRYVVRASRVPE